AEVHVLGREPRARFLFARADERVEAAKDAHEEQRELAFLAASVEELAAPQARDGGLAHAEHARELFLRQSERAGRAARGLGDDDVLVRRGFDCGKSHVSIASLVLVNCNCKSGAARAPPMHPVRWRMQPARLDFVPYPAIERHGLIGDRRTAALVA